MHHLIIGLGNMGDEYKSTRHNIGFRFADYLALKYKSEFATGRLAEHSTLKMKGKNVAIIKPTTYVNESGKAVRYWMNFYKIPFQNLLVVLDDIALPFGKIRLRDKGSDGGHNGLTSIQVTLQSHSFPRLRVGIGNEFPKGRQVEYVLGKFSVPEEKELPAIFENCHQQVLTLLTEGIAKAMNFNG